MNAERPTPVEMICRRISSSAEAMAQYERDMINLQNMGDTEVAERFAENQVKELEQIHDLTLLLTSLLTTDEDDPKEQEDEKNE